MINCPLAFRSCEFCSNHGWLTDVCYYYTPSRPLNRIRTPEERLERLETREPVKATPVQNLQQLKGQLLYLQGKVNEILIAKKGKGYKYK